MLKKRYCGSGNCKNANKSTISKVSNLISLVEIPLEKNLGWLKGKNYDIVNSIGEAREVLEFLEESMFKKCYCDSENCKNANKFTYGEEESIVREAFFYCNYRDIDIDVEYTSDKNDALCERFIKVGIR